MTGSFAKLALRSVLRVLVATINALSAFIMRGCLLHYRPRLTQNRINRGYAISTR